MATVTRYNLAQFVYEDQEITVSEFSTTQSIDDEPLTASNSYNAYGVDLSNETFEWELSDIDPRHRPFFQEMWENQQIDPSNLATVSTYDYNPKTGDIVEDDNFDGVYITEISKDNANKPFSVKGKALRRI